VADERVFFVGDLGTDHLGHHVVVDVPAEAAFPCTVAGELHAVHHVRAVRTGRLTTVVAIVGHDPESPWGPEWRPFVVDPEWKVTVTL